MVTEVSTFLVISQRNALIREICSGWISVVQALEREREIFKRSWGGRGGGGGIYTSEIGTVGLAHHPDREYVSYTLSGIFLSGSNGERLPRLQRHLDCCC